MESVGLVRVVKSKGNRKLAPHLLNPNLLPVIIDVRLTKKGSFVAGVSHDLWHLARPSLSLAARYILGYACGALFGLMG